MNRQSNNKDSKPDVTAMYENTLNLLESTHRHFGNNGEVGPAICSNLTKVATGLNEIRLQEIVTGVNELKQI